MENLKPKFSFRKILFLSLILNLAFSGKIVAQSPGSMYMLRDNFHSNILNPAYSRNDDAIVISVPILAGVTIGNSGSFKISDLILEDNSGQMVIDIDHFLNHSNNQNVSLTDWSSIPLLYVSMPFREGRLSFYLKEQIQSSLHFDLHALEFFNNGNVPVGFKNFNSENISYSGMGYRELSIGYSKKVNEKLDIGIRAKILFGAVYANVENWKYGIYTAENDETVRLTNEGTGKLSVPYELILDDKNRVKEVNSENVLKEYIGTLQNPGIGLDLGAIYTLNEKSWISASINDLGAIWYRDNAFNIEQNTSYTFTGFDLSNAIESSPGYNNHSYLNYLIKDSIRKVYRPKVEETNFVQTFVPKLALHYQYELNESFSFGATNQTAFYKNGLLNIFTISAMQKKGSISVFENVNAYGFNSFTVGAGVQYEGQFGQIFAVADNLLAVYHPAKNESYSISLGMSFLLNKPKKSKNSKGNFSPYLPFYDNKN